MSLAAWGGGNVYLRGKRWWLYYSVGGRMVRESSRTSDRGEAERLLATRIGNTKSFLSSDSIFALGAQTSRVLTCENTAANIGAIAELLVAADLMNRGHAVYRAINPNSPCDLVFLDGDGKLHRVEVKTGKADIDGKITACSPISNLNSFDVLAVVTRDGRVIYSNEAASLPAKCFVRVKRGQRRPESERAA